MEHSKRFNDLLAKGKLNKALDFLFQQEEFKNSSSLVFLKSRFEFLERDFSRGFLTSENYSVQLNVLTRELLDFFKDPVNYKNKLVVGPERQAPNPKTFEDYVIHYDETVVKESLCYDIDGESVNLFSGRFWLTDKIKNYIDTNRSGIVKIVGGPGSGKTTFLSHLRDEYAHPSHFIIRNSSYDSINVILQNLCSQLILKYGILDKEMPSDLMSLVRLWRTVLEAVSLKLKHNDEKEIILVDALDEINKGNLGEIDILEMLFPRYIPTGIFFITTMRGSVDVNAISSGSGLIIGLGDYRDDNLNDTITYVDKFIAKSVALSEKISKAGVDLSVFSDIIGRKTSGDFAYTKYLLIDILNGAEADLADYLDAIPPTVEAYFAKHIRRLKTSGGWKNNTLEVAKVLMFLRNPVSLDFLSRLTNLNKADVYKSLNEDWVQFIGRQKNPFGYLTYSIYHKGFADFLTDFEGFSYGDDLYVSQNRLIGTFLYSHYLGKKNTTSEIMTYTLRHILSHFIAYNELDKAVEVIDSENFLLSKYFELNEDFFQFISDFYEIYDSIFKVDPEKAESIIPRLIEFFVNRLAANDNKVTPDSIHALLVYRKSTDFYKKVITLLTEESVSMGEVIDTPIEEKYLTIFKIRLANVYRREGNFDLAEELLIASEKELEEKLDDTASKKKELSIIEYDIGYINYLQGDFKKAIQYFEESADHAKEAENIVGYWISKCVKARCSYLYAQIDISQFENVLKLAFSDFKRLANENQIAFRWMKNVNAHLFEANYYSKDVEEAAKYFELYINDPWVKEFHEGAKSDRYRGKMNILKGDYESAIINFSFLPDNIEDLKVNLDKKIYPNLRTEALAWDYYDLGRALYSDNQVEKSMKIWLLGLELPEDVGNIPFQRMIEQKLDAQ